jgi:hypothetical protein
MKYLQKYKIFEKNYGKPNTNFHCFIPYTNRKLFIIALSKVNADESIKKDIINYFIKLFDYNGVRKTIGYFLMFYDKNSAERMNIEWNYEGMFAYEDISRRSKELEHFYKYDTTIYSKYIGDIKLEDWEINAVKYNL